MEDLTIKIDGKEYRVKVEETEDNKILVHCGKDVYEVDTEHDKANALFNKTKKSELEGDGKSVIIAPLPGKILDIKVKENDKVKEGDSLIKLIAMKMENDIIAKKSGTVKEIKVKKNDSVNKDDILMIID